MVCLLRRWRIDRKQYDRAGCQKPRIAVEDVYRKRFQVGSDVLGRTVVGLRFISRLPPGSSQLPISRMNPRGESLFVGNSNQ